MPQLCVTALQSAVSDEALWNVPTCWSDTEQGGWEGAAVPFVISHVVWHHVFTRSRVSPTRFGIQSVVSYFSWDLINTMTETHLVFHHNPWEQTCFRDLDAS